MDWKTLDLIQVKPVSLKEWSESVQCVVKEMFMINRVKLATLDHVRSVSEFKDRHAGWF